MFTFRSFIQKLNVSYLLGISLLILSSSLFAVETEHESNKAEAEYTCPDSEKDCLGVCGGYAQRDGEGGCTLSNDRSDSYSYNEIAYNWQSGSMTGYTGSDDNYTTVDLPFSFPYYGNSYNTVTITTNGLVYMVHQEER